jgi:predicted acyltransferase
MAASGVGVAMAGEKTGGARSGTARIQSMDQFRGYTMAGMFLVNFVGAFVAVHPLLKHHNTYNSYADTIMPHFFFAVGFSLRLALLKNIRSMGRPAAYRKAVIRCLMLILIGLVVYHLDGTYKTWQDLVSLGWTGFFAKSFWQSPFQALVHIGVTSLWVLPVIAGSARARIGFLVASALAHLGLSYWFWYSLLNARQVIDGGMLGFLSWSIPTLVGSFAYDFVAKDGPKNALKPLLKWAIVLSLFGYALSCLNAVFQPVHAGGLSAWLVEPPFWPPSRPVDLWTMSQRAGSNSYLWFSAGFSLLVYALFVWWSDVKGRQWGMLRVFGLNPLAGYIIHDMIGDAVRPFAPADSPLYWVVFVFALYYGILWLFLWGLDRQKIYLRM